VVYDLFVSIFWEQRALLEFLQTSADRSKIFDMYRGFGTSKGKRIPLGYRHTGQTVRLGKAAA
jgi:hypothetical protein